MALSTFDAVFKSDDSKATEGVQINLGYNVKGEPITVWVAETGNPNHEKVQRRYSRQLEHSRKNRTLYNEIIAKIMAEAILIKWEGFLDEDGEPIPSTLANKTEMLKKYDRFMNVIMVESNNHENFAIIDPAADEETEKN